MSLSRTDLIPVLAIVAGGVIGASLSFGFLARSPGDDVPGVTLGLLYESSAPELVPSEIYSFEDAQRLQERFDWEIDQIQNRYENVTWARPVATLEGAMTCLSDGAVYRFRTVDGDSEWLELSSERIESFENPPLLCIDRVEEEAATRYLLQLERVGPNFLAEVDADDFERLYVLRPAEAVPQYGARASAGAVLITLKEDRPRR